MSIESPRLVVTDAQGRQQTLSLDSGATWNIGRSGTGSIVLGDEAASRIHALIQRTETGEYYLMDAGSRNGTFLRGVRVGTPVLLNDSDEISIGSHKLLFLNPASASAGEVTTATDKFQGASTEVMFAEHLVTVLVVDIQSFTKITQQIGQELLCSFVSRWFSDASRIFRSHGSWALKYIGDAVMAVWLHKPDEDHRLQVLSGLAAVVEFAEISSADRYSSEFLRRIQYRCGVVRKCRVEQLRGLHGVRRSRQRGLSDRSEHAPDWLGSRYRGSNRGDLGRTVVGQFLFA